MNFIIQTVNGQCRLDLCQAMQNAVEFDSWRDAKSIDEVVYCSLEELDKLQLDADKNYCPVGTLEFFFRYVDLTYGNDSHLKIKPLNVPKPLEKYALGKVLYSGTIETKEWFKNNKGKHRLFMKSMDKFKDEDNGFINIIDEVKENTQLVEENDYINNEWRVFIHNGEPIGINKYSGNPFIFPKLDGNFDKIMNIAAKECGIKEGTVDLALEPFGDVYVVECHDFFSCGLYGFSDYNAIPLMLWRTWIKIQRLFA